MPELFEFEEPQPINASHLVHCACVVCGGVALAAPSQAQKARCTACVGAGVDGSALRGSYTPGRLLSPLRPSEAVVEQPEVRPPVLVCLPECEHPMPDPVRDLTLYAIAQGWQVVVQHSAGGVMGGNGKQLADAQMWGMRLRMGAKWQGYAVRRGAQWESVCVAGETLPPFLTLGITELRTWLAEPEQPASWYAGLRAKAAAQAQAAKIVKCPGPGACGWTAAGEHTHRANGDIKPKASRSKREHGG